MKLTAKIIQENKIVLKEYICDKCPFYFWLWHKAPEELKCFKCGESAYLNGECEVTAATEKWKYDRIAEKK